MLTRAEARTDVQFYLNEPTTSRFGAEVFNRMINRAQRTVQAEILKIRKDFWYAQGYFTWPANQIKVDAHDLLNFKTKGFPYTLLSHGTMDQPGDESATNLMTDFLIVPWRFHNGQNTASFFPNAIGLPAYVGMANAGRQYPVTFQGQFWFMRPAPTVDLYVKVEWVPVLPDIPDGASGDVVQLLGGQLEEHHEAVVLEACLSINAARRLKSDELLMQLGRHYDIIASKENPTSAQPLKAPIIE